MNWSRSPKVTALSAGLWFLKFWEFWDVFTIFWGYPSEYCIFYDSMRPFHFCEPMSLLNVYIWHLIVYSVINLCMTGSLLSPFFAMFITFLCLPSMMCYYILNTDFDVLYWILIMLFYTGCWLCYYILNIDYELVWGERSIVPNWTSLMS